MANLVVRITDGGDGPDARAIVEVVAEGAPDMPIAKGVVDLPPLADGAEGDPLTCIREAFAAATSTDPDWPAKTGGYLFRALLGELQPTWAQVVASASPISSVVLDVQAPKLIQVPWELMADGPKHLFVDPDLAFSRGRGPLAPQVPPAAHGCGPLRVLVVIGTPGDTSLCEDDELSAVYSLFAAQDPDVHGLLHVELLRGPTREDLAAAMKALQPHVLHVVAHGETTAGGGASIRIGRALAAQAMTVSYIVNVLPPTPPLVVLNTCHSADLGAVGVQWSLAKAFHSRGSVAVVSMQGAIRSTAAVRFAGAFYDAVARGRPIDTSVAEGRKAIASAMEDASRDWALPVLSLTVDPGTVLPDLGGAPKLDELERIRRFVDRDSERRRLCSAVDPHGTDHLRVVIGREKVGKTSLLHSCLLTCFRRGRHVRYIGFGGRGNVSWLDAVRLIVNGTDPTNPSSIEGPLPEPTLSRLNHDVEELRQGHEPDPPPAPGVVVPPGTGLFEAPGESAHSYIERIFTSLLAELAAVAGDDGLVLALDDLSEVLAADVEDYLWPYLLRPIADGEVPAVRVILAAVEDRWARLPKPLQARVAPISLTDFDLEDAVRLTREYCARRAITFDAEWEEVACALKAAKEKANKTWAPATFRHIEKAIG